MKKYLIILVIFIFAILGTAYLCAVLGTTLFFALIETAFATEQTPAVDLFVAPPWLWPVIVTGTVQGLITYGAIKVKFDWLFTSLANLQKKQDEDNKAMSSRMDNVIFRNARRIGDGPDEH